MCHKSALGSDRAANGFLNAAVSTLVTPPDHITRQNDWTAKKNEKCRKYHVQCSIKNKCVLILLTFFLLPCPKDLRSPNTKLDSVGSTVRYEVMKLCTGSV